MIFALIKTKTRMLPWMNKPHSTAMLVLVLLITSIPLSASPQTLQLDSSSQKSMALTIYNDFALVRDTRKVVLPRGSVELEYLDVAKTIEPASVFVRSIGHESEFRLREQSYQYDLLNRQSLLETYIGRKLKYSRSVLQGTTFEKVLREGILLSTNPEIVDFGDEIEIEPEGIISLADLPESLRLEPTLVWLLDNDHRGEQSIETSYIADNINWHADYSLMLNEAKQTFDMDSWVTINNTSGAKFVDASIRLIAGNVNRVAPQAIASPTYKGRELASFDSVSTSSVSIASVFDYHQYKLPNKTSVKNNEEKQIQFMTANSVSYEKRYRMMSAIQAYQYPNVDDPQVQVSLAFKNSRKNHLGIPLAGGKVKAYTRDADGMLQLVGEAVIQHKAENEEVELSLGTAFDVKAKRKQIDFRRFDNVQGQRRSYEASYEILLTNARDRNVEVVVNEMMQGEWKIIEQNIEGKRENSTTQQFTVKVPAKGETTLHYRVRWML